MTISTDYSIKGDAKTISMSYKKLAHDVHPGSTILCSDGTITLTVLSCDTEEGTVKVRCENTAMLGERKNVNLPGVVVDLPTLTEKDKEDIMQWGVPNKIDLIALSFVRKGQDLVLVRELLGKHARTIKLMSKVCTHSYVQVSLIHILKCILMYTFLSCPYAQFLFVFLQIENQEGLVNFDHILQESDAIMVARGDLGMEIPVEKIFLAQKMKH